MRNPDWIAAARKCVQDAPFPLTATTSGRMTVHSRCLRAGRQLSYTEASVVDQDGDLVAHGTSTLMAMSGTALQLGVAEFVEV